jgi:ribonuclease BN (tRNA processing enzyme)
VSTPAFGFLVLGVGDAFSKVHYSSSLLLGCDESWLLVDCPHPIRKMLVEASASAGLDLDLEHLDGIALTHLHADHCSGLEGLLYFNHFVLKQKPTLLFHPDVGARLWSGHLSASMERTINDGVESIHSLDEYTSVIELKDEGALEFGPFAIECRKTVHPVPTTAFRIRAGGRSLGYSSDTSFDPGLVEWLSEADLVIHETNVGIHTDYQKLRGLPSDVRDRMCLIHYPDDFDTDGADIEALKQGCWYLV